MKDYYARLELLEDTSTAIHECLSRARDFADDNIHADYDDDSDSEPHAPVTGCERPPTVTEMIWISNCMTTLEISRTTTTMMRMTLRTTRMTFTFAMTAKIWTLMIIIELFYFSSSFFLDATPLFFFFIWASYFLFSLHGVRFLGRGVMS